MNEADLSPVDEALLNLRDEMQAFLTDTAGGGDVATLGERLTDLHGSLMDVHEVVGTQITYEGWLATDASPPPGYS